MHTEIERYILECINVHHELRYKGFDWGINVGDNHIKLRILGELELTPRNQWYTTVYDVTPACRLSKWLVEYADGNVYYITKSFNGRAYFKEHFSKRITSPSSRVLKQERLTMSELNNHIRVGVTSGDKKGSWKAIVSRIKMDKLSKLRESKKIVLGLNEEYDAVWYRGEDHIKVGCQMFECSTIKKLAQLLESTSPAIMKKKVHNGVGEGDANL